jgi:hypothetical protein
MSPREGENAETSLKTPDLLSEGNFYAPEEIIFMAAHREYSNCSSTCHFIDNPQRTLAFFWLRWKIVSQTNPKVLQAHKHETRGEFLINSHRQSSAVFIQPTNCVCMQTWIAEMKFIFCGLFMFSSCVDFVFQSDNP